MKLATIETDNKSLLAALIGDKVVNLTEALAQSGMVSPPTSVTEVIERKAQLIADIEAIIAKGDAEEVPPGSFRFAPPHLPQANVFCVGVNYQDHADEGSRLDKSLKIADKPTYFSRDSRSFCGAFDDIVVQDALSQMLDWEAELGVIIGTGGRAIQKSAALEHVFGYVIVNDISARDLQAERGQWFLGKNLSRTAPIGPYVVTADELGSPQELELTCKVDGVIKQQAHTANMIHGVADIIADLSRVIELRPGDVISTGTPSGVGAARQPPEFLQPDSRVEVEISGLGRQSNLVRFSD